MLKVFYEVLMEIAPRAWELNQDLLSLANNKATYYEWKLPDGYDVFIPVMSKKSTRLEVDELNHHKFTYEYYEQSPVKFDLSGSANTLHSIDAYICRSIHRRCNYNKERTLEVLNLLQGNSSYIVGDGKFDYYLEQYVRSTVVDIRIINGIDSTNVNKLTISHKEKLIKILQDMLQHKPFEVLSIHDAFKCHPNNMNHLRYHYKEILAELSDSNLLSDIFSQLVGKNVNYPKDRSLGDKIRLSNYALC